MPDITDPQVIKECNESYRPMAEDIRALKVHMDETVLTWFDVLAVKTPNDASKIQDGRDAEGVSRLVGTDANSLINIFIQLQNVLNQPGVPNTIQKFCVRRGV